VDGLLLLLPTSKGNSSKVSSCCNLTFVCLCIGCRVLVQLQGQFGLLAGWGVLACLLGCLLAWSLGCCAGCLAGCTCLAGHQHSSNPNGQKSKLKTKPIFEFHYSHSKNHQQYSLTAKTIISRKYSQHFQDCFVCKQIDSKQIPLRLSDLHHVTREV
jgi:hypothetical protein